VRFSEHGKRERDRTGYDDLSEGLTPSGAIFCAPMKSEPGPPMTLGGAAAARVRLIVWCKDCSHQVEPDPAEMAQQYGVETPVPDWRQRLVCSKCGSRQIDMVVSGERRG
jgi:hypothetical protein